MAAPNKVIELRGNGGYRKALRNWKDRFNPNAVFVWRRVVQWAPGDEGRTVVGAPIPVELAENTKKLRNFFEAAYIEMVPIEDLQSVEVAAKKPAAKKPAAKKPAAKKPAAKKPAAKKPAAKKPAATEESPPADTPEEENN